MHYEICNESSGHIFGIYEGDSPEEAVAAMMEDAGSPHVEPDESLRTTEFDVAETLSILAQRGFWATFSGRTFTISDPDRGIQKPMTYSEIILLLEMDDHKPHWL